MHDVTKLSDIRTELIVEIRLDLNSNENRVGEVHKINSLTDDPNGIHVMLKSGHEGYVIRVLNSPEIIKKRIMQTEAHNSENKEGFYEPVMRFEVIPKTVQSFLNSDGGYLYIGIFDPGETEEERIIGLSEDREIIKQKLQSEFTETKFQDKLRSDIEDSLEKFLISEKNFGPLIDYDFPVIDGKTILEINIRRCSRPVFYKHWTKSNKEMNFKIMITGSLLNGLKYENDKILFERRLDNFYYRDGSRKRETETFEEFLEYYNVHFQNG